MVNETGAIFKWSDDQWQAAVSHLLVCKKKIPECHACQEINEHVQQEPNRSIPREPTTPEITEDLYNCNTDVGEVSAPTTEDVMRNATNNLLKMIGSITGLSEEELIDGAIHPEKQPELMRKIAESAKPADTFAAAIEEID